MADCGVGDGGANGTEPRFKIVVDGEVLERPGE